MSWMSALEAWQWGVLLAVPPLVLMLYFLKLRRQPLEVPSTYLWQRTIEDMHVNSLWQRLRRNLLLLLQLLFLLALILACLRPGIHTDQATGRRWILMLDNSASMQATDLASTRLEAAKTKAKEQIGRMNRGDVAMLIAFSDRADIQQGFTGDARRLLAAIDRIPTTNRTTDINEAMRAAAGLANPGRVSFDGMNDIQVAEALPATVYLYSDGGFPDLADFERGHLSIEYLPIGTATIDNLGIEAFGVSTNEERTDKLEAYARVANYGPRPVDVTVSLYFDSRLLDATQARIEAENDTGIRFSLDALAIESGVFRLQLDRTDQLSIDNQAYAALRPDRAIQVLVVTPGNQALERSLSTPEMRRLARVQFESPSILASTAGRRSDIAFDNFDLTIFDQCTPLAMPPSNTLFIGESPPSEAWKLGDITGPIQLVDADRGHPLTSYMELGNIRIVEGRSVAIPESGQVLIQADNGPVFGIAPRGPFQDAVLGFKIVHTTGTEALLNTDWAIRPSFPVFIFGCIEHLGGGRSQSTASSILPGQPMSFHLPSRIDRFQVDDPSGHSASVNVDRDTGSGQFVWTATEVLGAYRIVTGEDKRTLDTSVVNLFSSTESNLAVRTELNVGDEKIVASLASTPSRREYWRWLLVVGLGLLVGEWVIYNRRILI